MLFHSAGFCLVFAVLILICRMLNRSRQNILLLGFSYFFYGVWNFKLIPLLLISTSVDYIAGRMIESSGTQGRRRLFLLLSVCCNLLMLGFFKYYNFFVESLSELLRYFGLNPGIHTLNIILPIGISFYTFQTISYTIDVYRGTQKAEKNFISFALFVSFFPQLIAGPIERAKSLLKQINSERSMTSENLNIGFYWFMTGLYKKVFIADNLAPIVGSIYDTGAADHNGVLMLIGGCAFAFQVYCDFAGYSEMARGLAKILGFDLMINFREPFLSRNPQELWRRWHISLSTWFYDYIFMPINRKIRIRHAGSLTAVMTAFLLSGLWHGAGWTFVVWGGFNGMVVVIYYVVNLGLKKLGIQPAVNRFLDLAPVLICRIGLTFFIFVIGVLFFRSESIGRALFMIQTLFTEFHPGKLQGITLTYAVRLAVIICPLMACETVRNISGRYRDLYELKSGYRIFSYLIMAYSIIVFGVFSENAFIYFQF